MTKPSIELSKTEDRLVAFTLVAVTVGEIVTSILHNTLGTWWPAIAVLVLTLVACGCWSLYFARSRHRSVWSVIALGLPDWLARRQRG